MGEHTPLSAKDIRFHMAFLRFFFSFVIAFMLPASLLAQKPLASKPSMGGAPVVTYRYDNLRSGANLKENLLTSKNLRPDAQGRIGFGKLFTRMVDGAIYGQPLYLPHVVMLGKGMHKGVHNVVYVTTANNSVYAFDADSCLGANAFPLWQQNLGAATSSFRHDVIVIVTLPYILSQMGVLPPEMLALFEGIRLPLMHTYSDFAPQIGITSTPVIDQKMGLLYVVAATQGKQAGRAFYSQNIYALDVATGKVRRGPVRISGSVLGNGESSSKGKVVFDPFLHLQSAALLLDHDTLYVTFGSHEELPSAHQNNANIFTLNREGEIENPRNLAVSHGWVFAYDIRTLTCKGVFCTTPNAVNRNPRIENLARLNLANPVGAGFDGVSMGPSADEQGNLYLFSGKGTFNRFDLTSGIENKSGTEYGNTLLRLSWETKTKGSGRKISVADFYHPSAIEQTTISEPALGEGGVMLFPSGADGVPNSHWGLASGRDEALVLLNRDNLGKYVPSGNPNMVKISASDDSSSPAYWNTPGNPTRVYRWEEGNTLQAWTLQTGKLSPIVKTVEEKTNSALQGRWSSGISLSASGGSNGLVWVSLREDSVKPPIQSGILHAFDVSQILTQTNQTFPLLWSSNSDPTGVDAPGKLPSGATPVVTGGKVYLPSISGELSVYGLLKDRRVIPVTAATYVDMNAPLMSFTHEKQLVMQGGEGGKMRKAILLRFVTPDFPPNHLPASALLTLQLHPTTYHKRNPGAPARPAKIFVVGMDDIGIWQPAQITGSNAPGIDPLLQKNRFAPLTGATRTLLSLQLSGDATSAVTLDVSDWIRTRPSMPVTLLLWKDGPESLTFFRQGNNGPILTLSWY